MEMIEQNKQVYDFNASFALLNKNVLEIFKNEHPNLANINCDNNILSFGDQSFQLGYFRLSQLSALTCDLPAREFFEVVKITSTIENESANLDEYLDYITDKLNQPTLNEFEANQLKLFISKYIEMKKYEDFLDGISNTTLSKYRQIVNNTLYLTDSNNLTIGQKLITEELLNKEKEASSGRSNSMARVLSNPDAPSILSEEDQGYSKGGFASIILILYSIINAAIILAIHFIK